MDTRPFTWAQLEGIEATNYKGYEGIVKRLVTTAKQAKAMADSLADSMRPYVLRHGACYTCYQYGAICSNPSSGFQAPPGN